MVNFEELLALHKRSLLDINNLLITGFDLNITTCTIDGVQDTIQELQDTLRRAGHGDWVDEFLQEVVQ